MLQYYLAPSRARAVAAVRRMWATTAVAISVLVFVTLVGVPVVHASDEKPAPPPIAAGKFQPGVDDQLGKYIPKDLIFENENGDSVRLGSLIDRPTVLSLVYYQCTAVCRPLLSDLADMLGKLQGMAMQPGKDYRVLTVSFDETDTPEGSAQIKSEYYSQLPDGFPKDAWTFLTADSATIHKLTDAVGFHFRRQGKMFVHPTTLVILSSDGKICRYLYGSTYLPADIKLALMEASKGVTGPTIARFLRFCFSYHPSGQKYVLDITRIVGLSGVMGVVGLVVFLKVTGRKRKNKEVG